MKYSVHCDHCGHSETAYTHKLNKGLVLALSQLVAYYERHHRRAHILTDLGLTINQAANFQKLRYWGVVHRDNTGWIPTDRGAKFIHGEIKIIDTAASFSGETLDYNHEAWKTHIQKVQAIGVEDFIEPLYKPKEEYQAERQLVPTLFSI